MGAGCWPLRNGIGRLALTHGFANVGLVRHRASIVLSLILGPMSVSFGGKYY